MFRSKAQWIDYDPSEEYTLTIAFPEIPVYTYVNNRNRTKVAICESCKNVKTRRYPPVLSPIPPQIKAVPMTYRKFLSPVYMNCSLGRTAGSNPYTNYRFLNGNIFLSKNYHALELYSGSIGAFLNSNEPPNWFHSSLIAASNWLKENNPIFKQYRLPQRINESSLSATVPLPLPLARSNTSVNSSQASTSSRSNSTIPDLVVPNDEFPLEIHDEDYRYHRLMAGFMKLDDITLPISYGDPELEALMFPDLFSRGK